MSAGKVYDISLTIEPGMLVGPSNSAVAKDSTGPEMLLEAHHINRKLLQGLDLTIVPPETTSSGAYPGNSKTLTAPRHVPSYRRYNG